jgi:hypothetical protein|tara:strand:- start:465 stop:704 length:240 start_codon:yes stop_codon:yes gene_type:complete
MNEFKLDIKFAITMITLIGSMGGFYFTTNWRMEELEKKVVKLEKSNDNLIRLEERVKTIQSKTDEIYKVLLNINNGSQR